MRWTNEALGSGEWDSDPRRVAIRPPNYYRDGDFGYDSDQIIILRPFEVAWTDIRGEFLSDLILDPYDDHLQSIRDIRELGRLEGNEWLRRITERVEEQADWLTEEELTPEDWEVMRRTRYWDYDAAPAYWPSMPIHSVEDALGFDPAGELDDQAR